MLNSSSPEDQQRETLSGEFLSCFIILFFLHLKILHIKNILRIKF